MSGGQTFTLWDLDNCLADDGWRIARIDWAQEDPDLRYAWYHEGIPCDLPGDLRPFWTQLLQGHTPIFVTARPMAYYLDTQRWIRRYLGIELRTGQLRMRNNGDRGHSHDIKRALIADLPHTRVVAAYDDHPEVLEMYRSLAIPATELRIHNLDAYNRPTEAAR